MFEIDVDAITQLYKLIVRSFQNLKIKMMSFDFERLLFKFVREFRNQNIFRSNWIFCVAQEISSNYLIVILSRNSIHRCKIDMRISQSRCKDHDSILSENHQRNKIMIFISICANIINSNKIVIWWISTKQSISKHEYHFIFQTNKFEFFLKKILLNVFKIKIEFDKMIKFDISLLFYDFTKFAF